MKLSRKTTLRIAYILDQLVPPAIRDSKWFMWLPMKILFRKKYKVYMDFKNKFMNMSYDQLINTYKETAALKIDRATDINDQCLAEITTNITGKSVLEAGCGRCYLAGLLNKKHQVTASDMVINPDIAKKHPDIIFQEANIENLSFKDEQFDTVICTHVLEHVPNIHKAISELRRVTKKRLIIVVPKQRPYKYTFDLHIHFFPYTFSFMALMGNTNDKNRTCRVVGGDILYIEDK